MVKKNSQHLQNQIWLVIYKYDKCFLSTTKIWFDWLRFFCTNKNTFFMMILNLINNILFFFNITWRTNAHQSILVVLGMIFILFLQFISLVKICLPMTGQCWRKRKLVKNIPKNLIALNCHRHWTIKRSKVKIYLKYSSWIYAKVKKVEPCLAHMIKKKKN